MPPTSGRKLANVAQAVRLRARAMTRARADTTRTNLKPPETRPCRKPEPLAPISAHALRYQPTSAQATNTIGGPMVSDLCILSTFGSDEVGDDGVFERRLTFDMRGPQKA